MNYLLDHEETERLRFQQVSESDFEQWLVFFKEPSSFIHWIQARKDPEEECREWYEKQRKRYTSGRGGMNALVEKKTGRLIGHCGLLVQFVDGVEELEIGYSLLPAYHNKGFATEAAKKCRDFAFINDFSESLISIISLTNAPSMNVARKNGMKIDKQTVYNQNDVYIFRITKEEWKSLNRR